MRTQYRYRWLHGHKPHLPHIRQRRLLCCKAPEPPRPAPWPPPAKRDRSIVTALWLSQILGIAFWSAIGMHYPVSEFQMAPSQHFVETMQGQMIGTPFRRFVHFGSGGRSSVSGSTATVFGASGFLARYVVSKFGRTGTQVVVPHRGEEYDVRHCKVMGDLGQITPMKLDQRSEDSIARALARSNIVINCIGSWVPTFHNTLSETHAEASERIAKVAKRMGVKQFVHISALSASPNATDAWSKSKWEGEVAVRKVFPEAVILRPGTMCGPEDKFLNRLADRMRSYPVMPEWGFGEAKVQPVSVYDVAEAVNVVANKGSAYHGRVFDLAGPKVYTMADVLTFIETTCGIHTNRVPVPTSVGLMIGSLIESAPYASLYESEVALQTQDVTLDGSSNETFEALGIKPESIERLAPEYLRRFREGSHYKQVDPSSKGGHIDI